TKIDAGETSDISFDAREVKELMIQHPKLWWPNGYGQPNLYRMRIQYTMGNEISDDTSFAFGIRTVSSKATMVNGFTRRDFYVNGERIHITGGAWVPDMMLNRDSTRNDYELHLCRNSNINLVRIWGGGLGETDDFYELADKYGLLVWQDFWITGDTQGEFKGSRDWPLQANVFIRNVVSTILRIRNHPSLLVWTGGNEGHAREELYNAMRDNVAMLDGTRPFIPCSSGFANLPKGWKGSWPDDQPSGVYSGGPYSWVDESRYYQLADRGRDWLFKDETGVPSQPPYSTLPKIISNLVPDSSLPYPLNNTWGYHDACSGNGRYDVYYKNMVQRYGEPEGMKDYCDKMQLMNADSYRAIFEAAEHKLDETGGVMLWKLNAAFPSVIWQVYDWYLEPNAGYYFMQNACEPVHIQLNLDDSGVAVVNKTYRQLNSLAFTIRVMHMDGTVSFTKTGAASVNAYAVKKLISIKSSLAAEKDIAFVFLDLKSSDGKRISENVYWFAPEHDFTKLRDMPAAAVEATKVGEHTTKDSYECTLKFSNTTRNIAFFINPQLINNGEEILPAFWSKNYFSLAPHESVTVTVRCPLAKIDTHSPVMLKTEGWNVKAGLTELGKK
ncbi:MAG TPA: glycoside hydrolase family 2 TIM barrel-domain containing protein, partial [Chitinophagaceae bacterium]|nr:glycoside hydrolase family 2 TIM barrel-domain containing protein [Chitinophagaceae bacterium]